MINQIGYIIHKYTDKHWLYAIPLTSLVILVKPYHKQRSIQPHHVEEIKQHQIAYLRKKGHLDLIGTIIIAQKILNLQTFQESPLYIIDGQHRFEALKKIISDGYIDDISLVIEYFKVENDDEMFELFRNINLNLFLFIILKSMKT
jgi:hypothetical protein